MSDAELIVPSGELARQLLEQSGDAIVIADRDGAITFWNVGAEAMFGFRSVEAVGQSLELIIPERLRERHRRGYLETMRTGTTRYAKHLLAVPGIRRDGSRISLEFQVTLLTTSDGDQPGAIAAVIRDVTERWEEGRELRERIRTLESLVSDGAPSTDRETNA